MKMSCIPHGLALAVALVTSSGAFAATELRPLSDSEMSGVYGRGLSDPALNALGALTTSEQSGSAVSAQATAEALAGFGGLTSDGLTNQQSQQQRLLQSGTTTIAATLQVTSTMAAISASLAPLTNTVSLGTLMMPFPFMLAALPSLDAINKKH